MAKKVVLNVPDISCEHCENAITKVLKDRPGVTAIQVDIPAKQVHLDFEEGRLSLDQVKGLLAAEDYPVESVVWQ